MLNIVNVAPVEFLGGYGYRISPGLRAEYAKGNANRFLKDHEEDINWLFDVFGGLNSAQLELTSTIVYVDREFAKKQQPLSIAQITARVNEIKPHFNREEIRGFVEQLLRQGVLISTVRSLSRAN
jgi:hypothetical protein